jgi:methionine synthase II (cobalamin-independent)
VSQDHENGSETDAMAAIREAVEEQQKAFGALDDGILDLDDVVWRSPARAIVDPTDTISRLAEEADKVAKGIEDVPPAARIHRPRAEPDFGTAGRKPSSTASGDNAEASIRALVMATLEDQGKIGPDGKLAVSEEEVRRLVREHIDQWMAQQMNAGD